MQQIVPIPAFDDNYIWVLHDQQHALVVDPGDASPVLTYLQKHQLHLAAVLITHHHWDHVSGITDLIERHPAPVYGPETETITGVTHTLREGDTVSIPELEKTFAVWELPGHTLGHIAYLNDGFIFSGDTLFAAGCGRLFEGTPTQMFNSLTRLASLPDNTLVYCTHEYTLANLHFATAVEPDNPDIRARLQHAERLRSAHKITLPTSVGLEKKTNPFLRCHTDGVKQSAEQRSQTVLTSASSVFTAVRAWKDQF